MLFIPFLLLAFLPFFVKIKFRYYDLLIIIFSAVLLWQSVNLPDFANMEAAYNISKYGIMYADIGIGWSLLCSIGGLVIDDYRIFWIIIFLISAVLTRSTVNYYIRQPESKAVIWGCFMIYPLMLEGIQMRFFLAESIILFFTRFLFDSSRAKRLIYAVVVIIMFFIHSSVLVYLLFWAAVEFSNFRKIVPAVSGAIFLIVTFGMKLVTGFASLFVNSLRIETYFNNQDSAGILGLITYFAITIMFIWIAYSIRRQFQDEDLSHLIYAFLKDSSLLDTVFRKIRISQGNTNQDCDIVSVEKTSVYLDKFYYLAVSSIIFIPLTLIDNNFFRLQRILWILIFIQIAFLRENGYKKIKLYFLSDASVSVNSNLMVYVMALAANIAMITAFNPELLKCYFFH